MDLLTFELRRPLSGTQSRLWVPHFCRAFCGRSGDFEPQSSPVGIVPSHMYSGCNSYDELRPAKNLPDSVHSHRRVVEWPVIIPSSCLHTEKNDFLA